jgi:ABC-2 type transport system permease protein
MKYGRMLLIHLQRVLEQRMRSFIWFLMTLINPIMLIYFWKGALQHTNGHIQSWVQADFNSYYLMLMLASNFLVVHIEEHIAFYDIRQGTLANHLIRPFSYYWMMFFYEMPYRIIQGTYGIISATILFFYFSEMSFFNLSITNIILILIILVSALFISFTFKVIIGLMALWITEIDGIGDMLFILSLIFGGYIIPLEFLPPILKNFIFLTPFPWITYYPVLALLGKLTQSHMIVVILQQAGWLLGVYFTYTYIWRTGTKKFTAVGQ